MLYILFGKKNTFSRASTETNEKVAQKKSELRIFLSYGHDEYSVIAQQIKKDLETQGFKVWFDMERLHAGIYWESSIEEGLKWVKESPDGGKFLLLMTPHSVRRPDGFCLNELARALDYHMMIIPVMIVSVEPPLAICRLQWLDFRDSLPLRSKKKRYRHKISLLQQYLEHKFNLETEGYNSRLKYALEPLHFSGDINWHLPRFTGRKWLFDDIRKWLDNPNKGSIYWITGLPGCGKTAISSYLINNFPEIAAFHLCRYGYSEKADPARCIKSIAYQLSTQLTNYRERLNSLDLESLRLQNNPYDLFDNLIIQPLCDNYPHPGQIVTILIDALDEATIENRNSLALLISTEMPKAPPWLKLIITSRDEPEVMTPLQGLRPNGIEITSEENLNDLREYLRHELSAYETQEQPFEEIISCIIEKSEGLFLYAEKIREEVINGYLSLDSVEEFPEGLGGYYYAMFERQFPADKIDYANYIRPVLDVLAAYPEINVNMMETLFEWSEHTRIEFFQKMGAMFSIFEDRLKPFHKSLLDWLVNPEKAGKYHISAREGFMIIKRKCDAALSGKATNQNSYWMARLMREITWFYHKDNVLVNNIDYLIYVRDVFKKTGEHSRYLQAICDIARAYRETGNPDKARIIGEEGIIEAIKAGDTLVRGNFYHILGGSYYDLGYFDQAMIHFKNALKDFENVDEMGCTAVRRRMANVMVKQGRFNEAISCLKQVLEEYRYRFHSLLGVVLTLTAFGNCYWDMGEEYREEAVFVLLAAKAASNKYKVAHKEAFFELLLCQIEQEMGHKHYRDIVDNCNPWRGEYSEYIKM